MALAKGNFLSLQNKEQSTRSSFAPSSMHQQHQEFLHSATQGATGTSERRERKRLQHCSMLRMLKVELNLESLKLTHHTASAQNITKKMQLSSSIFVNIKV